MARILLLHRSDLRHASRGPRLRRRAHHDVPTAKAFEAERERAGRGLVELLERAQAAGKLREDFVHQDVPLILMANAGVITGTRHTAPDAWRRLVGFLIQAFAADAAQPLPEPPSQDQMYQAVMRLPSHPVPDGRPE